jgi:hypothetical protein
MATASNRSAGNRLLHLRNNPPGTPAFCPIVRKTPEWADAVAVDLPLSDPALRALQAEILEPRTIAVTGIGADLRAFVERAPAALVMRNMLLTSAEVSAGDAQWSSR